MREEYKKGSKAKKKDSRLKNAGVSGYNKPKRTPSHPTKSHVVVAKVGDKIFQSRRIARKRAFRDNQATQN